MPISEIDGHDISQYTVLIVDDISLNTILLQKFLSQFTADSPDNYINLNYPAYNEFIDKALSGNGTDSIDALTEAERYLIDYGYLYPLYYESRYFASADNVCGAIFGTTGESIDFTQITKGAVG